MSPQGGSIDIAEKEPETEEMELVCTAPHIYCTKTSRHLNPENALHCNVCILFQNYYLQYKLYLYLFIALKAVLVDMEAPVISGALRI